MKHYNSGVAWKIKPPAAFGRLCVETKFASHLAKKPLPAAFGRLCVETSVIGF